MRKRQNGYISSMAWHGPPLIGYYVARYCSEQIQSITQVWLYLWHGLAWSSTHGALCGLVSRTRSAPPAYNTSNTTGVDARNQRQVQTIQPL